MWQAAEAFIRNVPELKELHAAAITYMQSLMQVSHKRDLNPFYEDIPVGLKKGVCKGIPRSENGRGLFAGILATKNGVR